MLRVFLGSCLWDINKIKPLYHYSIFLPEKEEYNLSSMLKLTIDKLTQVILSCSPIIIWNNVIMFDLMKLLMMVIILKQYLC